MIVEKTQRGFEIIKFKDEYNAECSLQQSSLAIYEQPGSSAIWLGIDRMDSRMHLTAEMVIELVKYLQNWIDTGHFGDGHEKIERIDDEDNQNQAVATAHRGEEDGYRESKGGWH